MLAGEIEYRKGNFDTAFKTLREAVRCARKELQLEGTRITWKFPSLRSLTFRAPFHGRFVFVRSVVCMVATHEVN